jgi:hypothetical protein
MTPEEAARNFELLKGEMKDIIYASMYEGANEFTADMGNRVFNQGNDKNNTQIGEYSPAYAEYRKSKGRQTSKVDLTLFGNLKRSIKIVRMQGGWQVKFINDRQAKIARSNEVRFKGAENTIFDISQKEKEDMLKVTDLEFQARFRDAAQQAGLI